jgi:hypothetical protein
MSTIPVGISVPSSRAQLSVRYGETWHYEFPQLVQADSGDPFNITSATLEIVVRPSASHATEFARITSAVGGPGDVGIVKTDATKGLAVIHAGIGYAESRFPLSLQNGWWHMLRIFFTDPDFGGGIKRILVEGPFWVLPSRDV